MANPRNVRKFSEKIALHNQKQAEETAEFEKIMREVQGVTVKDSNVIDERTIHKSRSTEIFKRIPTSTSKEYKCSGRQAGGPMRHKRPEYSTSPYHSGNMSYLSPPTENNWRRSSSDSAIHQTLNHITLQEVINVEESNMGSNTTMNRKIINNDKYVQAHNQSHAVNNIDMRPRSSSQITNCNFEQTSGTRLDAPTTVNTGSLPDLSSIHLLFQPSNTASGSTNNYCYYSGWDKSGIENMQSIRPEEAQQMNSLKTDVLDFQTLQMLNNPEDFSPSIGDSNEKELLNEYRIPPVRPSPGSSPNLQGNLGNYEFDHSAPCSPTTQIKNNFQSVPDETEGYYENSLKNLEQFSLQDDGLSAQLLDCMSFSGLDVSNSISNNSRNSYLETDASRNTFNSNVPEMLSPNIPEIVLTDYSSNNDVIAKDILGDTFELGQMDMVGLQMLSDPDIITDPITEDSLRRDLNLN